MRVWYAKFEGQFPVGAVAVAVARTQGRALAKINETLAKQGFKPVELDEVKEIESDHERAEILLDGDY